MIAQYRAKHPARLMCRVRAVSPAAFYAWERRPPSARAHADARLRVTVAARRDSGHPPAPGVLPNRGKSINESPAHA